MGNKHVTETDTYQMNSYSGAIHTNQVNVNDFQSLVATDFATQLNDKSSENAKLNGKVASLTSKMQSMQSELETA